MVWTPLPHTASMGGAVGVNTLSQELQEQIVLLEFAQKMR
jgi:hypothetical protein